MTGRSTNVVDGEPFSGAKPPAICFAVRTSGGNLTIGTAPECPRRVEAV